MVSIENNKESEPNRTFLLFGSLSYIAGVFLSQAFMSIGLALLGASVLSLGRSLLTPNFYTFLGAHRFFKTYFIAATLVIFSTILSVAVSYFFPLTILGTTIRCTPVFDLGKSLYLYIPFVWFLAFQNLDGQSIGRLRTFLTTAPLVLLAYCVVQSVFGVKIQFNPLSVENLSKNYGIFQIEGLYGNYLTLSTALFFPLCFSLQDLYAVGLRRRVIQALGLWSIFAAMSRNGWITLLFYSCYLIKRLKPKASLIISLLASTGVILWIFFGKTIVERASHPTGIIDRLKLWKTIPDILAFRPWTGVGWRHTAEAFEAWGTKHPELHMSFYSHAHNNALEILLGGGWIALSAWIYFNYVIIRFLKGPYRMAWICFHLNGLTQVNFWETKCLHVALVFLSFAVWDQVSKDKIER